MIRPPTPAGSTSGWTTTRQARGSDDPPMVARGRAHSLPARAPSGHYRRRRRIERLPRAIVETQVQRLADRMGLSIEVHHLPPGTSKWNKIEHRLFSFIAQNWRAKPLLSYRVIVELIGATTTQAGLTVQCELDAKAYPKGIVVSDEQNERHQHPARALPRRMELLDLAINSILRAVNS